MSFHDGSNWQARKEDEKKPLYENEKKNQAGGPGENVSVPRDVVRNVLAVMEVNNPAYEDSINALKKSLQRLAGGQSAGVWRHAYYDKSKLVGLPESNTEEYFIKYDRGTEKDKGTRELIIELCNNGWERVYWLDESLQPATTGEEEAINPEYAKKLAHAAKICTNGEWDDILLHGIDMAYTSGFHAALATSPNATERQEGEKMTEQELEDKFEACFDKNTSATGGGYEADSTNMQGLWNDFLPFIHQFANTTHTQ